MKPWLPLLLCLGLVACVSPGPPPSAPAKAPAQAPAGDRYYPIAVDHAPPLRVDPAAIPDAVPRPEAVTAAGNRSPYTVLGKTYHVMPSSRGYREDGIASWYGMKFHGHKTSNGEIYNAYEMSAAHKTLPLPSYVRVTNLANGMSAVVRVNDRGPFKEGRIIDLSYAAATKLGFVDQGTARVRVEAIDTTGYPAQPSLAAGDGRGGINPHTGSPRYLQVGAFREELSAQRLRDEIGSLLSQAAVFVQPAAGGLFRVRIGPFFSDAEILTVQQQLAAAQYGLALVVQD